MRALLTARAFVGLTVAAAAGVLVALASLLELPTLAELALFCAAAILAEHFQVETDDLALHAGGARRFSFSSGVHLAAVIVAGPLVAAVAAATGVLVVDRLDGRSWLRTSFNAAVFVLATAAGFVVFAAAGGSVSAFALPDDLAPFAALCGTYSLVNTVLVAGVISLSEGTPFWRYARTSALGDVSSDLAEASLAGALAFCILRDPWAVGLLGPLAIAAYQAHARLALLRLETAQALETFATVVDERDPYTFKHSERVADTIRRLGEALKLPHDEVARLAWAGRLHDLGKIAVDSSILGKAGPLDADERRTLERHPRLSARLLRRFRFAREHARAVEYHHERFDGNGYYGIENAHLPLASHVLIVTDSYDAMTSDRPYRRGMTAEQALAELERGSGTQFHPTIVKAFAAMERGEDVLSSMTRAELAELHRLSLSSRRRPLALMRRVQTSTLMIAGVAAALVALALHSVGLALAATALGALASARQLRGERAAGRLVRGLAGIEAGDPFEAAMEVFADDADFRWGGLVAWREQELAGSLTAAWNRVWPGPSEAALTSWLIRDAAGSDELLLEDGVALGSSGRYAALPLQRDGVVRAFLVLAYGRTSVPPPAKLALSGFPTDLAARLVALAEPPGLRAVG
jgi:HD-GYP domain-containing protein (c-di-GMP phosphodiesterase class II)